MRLFIKNMMCLRCKMMVKSELENLGLHHTIIELGEVHIVETLTEGKRHELKIALRRSGLELIDDKKSILIEKIKTCVIDLVYNSDDLPHINFSEFLSSKLKYDYKYLSSVFSEVKGITIECFVIAYKIERVKELLIYEDLTLTEISYKLKYSSVAHLSMQFKKSTGLTPTFFKKIKLIRRETLDSL
ncbi:MAG: helix-turn-helix domain-containing protein [Bacteroidota bacterium]|nr:helix-turn-helix domain-containing protein [Bacteroidota bacterium]